MRLTHEQVSTIIQTIRSVAGQDAKVWLYGSRLDDSRRGGDIDLLIESEPIAGLITRARIKNRIEHILQLPVDVLATSNGIKESSFIKIARTHAIPLDCE